MKNILLSFILLFSSNIFGQNDSELETQKVNYAKAEQELKQSNGLEATGKEHEPSKNKEPSDNNKEPSESNAKPESYSKIKKTNNKDKNSSPKVNKNSFKREKSDG